MNNEQKLTIEEINKNIDDHINQISKEFKRGFEFLKKYPKSVTFFGSSHLTKASSHYDDARKLAGKIVEETGYTIITGGGPGIMEAVNQGAKEANGNSLGLGIRLPQRQHSNSFTTSSVEFDYFFTRKAMLAFAAEVFVFFPGGFGTFDELFSILTLIQTKKIPQVPLILFGKDFWIAFKDFIEKNMLNKHHTIDATDINLFVITESIDTVLKIIKEAKVSEWWKNMD